MIAGITPNNPTGGTNTGCVGNQQVGCSPPNPGDIGDPRNNPIGGSGNWIDSLPIPGWLKNSLMPNLSEGAAAKTMNQFQGSALGGERITKDQMKQMAQTGTITKKDGTTMPVPRDVQAAAKRFMADDAKLFKTMESSTDGKNDGELGFGDYQQALNKGRI
jgi:hypothetical protein